MRVAFVLILLFTCTIGQSQLKFHSQNYIGVLEGGAAPSAFQLQSINGLQSGTWFGGVGTGIDYYFVRTVPLFLSFTEYFTAKDRSFYVTLDGGFNFVWDKTTGNLYNGFRSDGDFKPALYFGASAGYKIGLKNKRDAILLNIGYSAKHLKEKIRTNSFCNNPPCTELYEKYDYELNRLSLKIGWMF